ncbi:hypothetical protein Sme01_64410 [Sphaerisporangium melleum]|uniref:Uncharacterized protein n=1 Tax=Sphaerisporangium melleum TaxID=321316 RepID=A0A917VQR9_9ACTN|nr:hypothetical protein GCM10007964_53790 [Sphaerisporangium melleum]GII73965.1 hypothetical protein Sme01_64410 [Sphaerisporangium melleum]
MWVHSVPAIPAWLTFKGSVPLAVSGAGRCPPSDRPVSPRPVRAPRTALLADRALPLPPGQATPARERHHSGDILSYRGLTICLPWFMPRATAIGNCHRKLTPANTLLPNGHG